MAQFVKFDKIVPEGKALAHWHDKALFAVGPLPGESATVRITREKRDWAEGVVRQFAAVASPHRGPAHEDHYLSCSPWQGVDYQYQLELKRGMLAELFGRPGLELPVAEMLPSPRQFGYRNKLEFSLKPDERGRLELAFHERGSFRSLIAATQGCVLGSEAMNAAARAVMERLNELDVADIADTLTVRQSHTHGHVIVVVMVRESAARNWDRLVVSQAAGVAVARKVRHDTYETLWTHGNIELAETFGGVELAYPWDSFFQVNLPGFELALERILTHIQPGTKVVDLYGGAGTIGLPAARIAREVAGVEIVASSVALANRNALSNQLANYQALAAPSEKIDPTLLADADAVIVDPPRAGLHKHVIRLLLEARPRQIIYLSCNPVTQVRDIMLLANSYTPGAPTGFDFYPGTLHLESLAVLTLTQ